MTTSRSYLALLTIILVSGAVYCQDPYCLTQYISNNPTFTSCFSDFVDNPPTNTTFCSSACHDTLRNAFFPCGFEEQRRQIDILCQPDGRGAFSECFDLATQNNPQIAACLTVGQVISPFPGDFLGPVQRTLCDICLPIMVAYAEQSCDNADEAVLSVRQFCQMGTEQEICLREARENDQLVNTCVEIGTALQGAGDQGVNFESIVAPVCDVCLTRLETTLTACNDTSGLEITRQVCGSNGGSSNESPFTICFNEARKTDTFIDSCLSVGEEIIQQNSRRFDPLLRAACDVCQQVMEDHARQSCDNPDDVINAIREFCSVGGPLTICLDEARKSDQVVDSCIAIGTALGLGVGGEFQSEFFDSVLASTCEACLPRLETTFTDCNGTDALDLARQACRRNQPNSCLEEAKSNDPIVNTCISIGTYANLLQALGEDSMTFDPVLAAACSVCLSRLETTFTNCELDEALRITRERCAGVTAMMLGGDTNKGSSSAFTSLLFKIIVGAIAVAPLL